MPISPDHLAIYFNAGMATAAYEFGVDVHRLSLRVNAGRRDRPQIMPLADFIKSRRGRGTRRQAYIDYATVLLAGSAGRCLGLETYLAYPKPHLDMLRLQHAHLAEAALCLEQETDRAFAIILAWLPDVRGGDPFTAFDVLWDRALQLLRHPEQQGRIAAVADAIRRQRQLQRQELLAILNS